LAAKAAPGSGPDNEPKRRYGPEAPQEKEKKVKILLTANQQCLIVVKGLNICDWGAPEALQWWSKILPGRTAVSALESARGTGVFL
jgi:hypothetical protein